MLREYIQNVIANSSSVPTDDTVKGKINSRVISAITNWAGQLPSSSPQSIQELIEYEVNAYMAAKAGKTTVDAIKRQNAPTTLTAAPEGKKKRLVGIVTVTTNKPPSGQIEDGTVIHFNSVHDIQTGDRFRYSYNPSTGVYTVDTASRGKLGPCPGMYSGGEYLSEQFGRYLFTQSPSATSWTSINGDITKDSVLKASDSLIEKQFIRIDDNVFGVIDETAKTYTEYKGSKDEDGNKIIVPVLSIPLGAHMDKATNEYITIGKYLLWDGFVLALMFKHTAYVTKYKEKDDPKLGMMYDSRSGQASIRGELLIIDRVKGGVSKMPGAAYTAYNQIYWSGVNDIAIDQTTGLLVIAELSTIPNTRTLTYDAAKIVVKPVDRIGYLHRGPDDTELTDTYTTYKVSDFNTWITKEYGSYGMPKFVHIVKDGSKSWELAFPSLTITSYKLDLQQMVLDKVATLYSESTSTFTTKYSKTVVGGYTRAMLYQDIFDAKFSWYVGRSYDAWLAYPWPSSDYTVVPKILADQDNRYLFESSTYVGGAIPGELIGFFGIEYSILTPEKTLKPLVDIPGGNGLIRGVLSGDPIAGTEHSVYLTTSYETLLCLNNYVSTAFIAGIRQSVIHDTFNGGTNNFDWDYPPTESGTRDVGFPFQFVWNYGINFHTNRFAVVRDAADLKKKQLVFAGAFQPMPSTAGGYAYRAYHIMEIVEAEQGSTGLFFTPIPEQALSSNQWHVVKPAGWNYYVKKPTTEPYDYFPYQYMTHLPQWTTQTPIVSILMMDQSSYYVSFSFNKKQWDYFTTFLFTYARSLGWWFQDRQYWTFKNADGIGWLADLYANGDSASVRTWGADKVHQQLY